jgi:hypothetical protein
MSLNFLRLAFVVPVALTLVPLHAATVSRQNAEEFSKKIAVIQRNADAPATGAARRTRLSEDEVNSWFMYHSHPLLPTGLSQPQVTILGEGRLAGQAVVDLDAVAKRRPSTSAGGFDPFSLIGGKVPVSVTGILHTQDSKARFEVQRVEMSGIPVPVTVLQELLSYYSRSEERPQGLRLDDVFALPSKIRQIEVGQGQAVVVQ